MRSAFVTSTLPEMADLLNRPSARTWSRITPLSLAVFDASQTKATTLYLDVYWPMEAGVIVRAARINPSASHAHSGSAATVYATIALGVKRAAVFDALGRVYDSRTRDLSVGVPFPIVQDESAVALGSGVVVRVVVTGWPIQVLVGSSVETFLGYEG